MKKTTAIILIVLFAIFGFSLALNMYHHSIRGRLVNFHVVRASKDFVNHYRRSTNYVELKVNDGLFNISVEGKVHGFKKTIKFKQREPDRVLVSIKRKSNLAKGYIIVDSFYMNVDADSKTILTNVVNLLREELISTNIAKEYVE